ncbi:MAG: hypothetical protein RLZZ506_377 [Bacteroidota bacterium]
MCQVALNMPAIVLRIMVLSRVCALVYGAFCAAIRCHMAVMILR